MSYYCWRCRRFEVESVAQETLHGNIYTPASDTEIEIEFRCAACDAHFSWHAYDEQTLSPWSKPTVKCNHCGTRQQLTSYQGRDGTAWCLACKKTFQL
jgi:DNA-directed RNA polymerase subunit RPC12/RpoP